jgi:multiple sugar transport system permease protein
VSRGHEGRSIRDAVAGGRPSRAGAAFTHAALWAAALLWMAPVVVMVVASFKPDALVLAEAGSLRAFVPTDMSLQNYRDVFERVPFGRILLNSLIINGSIVVGGLAVNSVAAYALARLRWRGRDVVLALVLSLLVVPFEAIAVPLFYGTTELGWRDTYLVQIAPFVANALSIYLFYTFFLDLPTEVEDAARVDGAGPWRVFLEIVVPQSRSAFAAVAIVTSLLQWGLYLWPLLVTSRVEVRPLPVGIAAFRTLPPVQWGDIMAFAVLMVTPVVVAFIALQSWFVRSVAATGIKG